MTDAPASVVPSPPAGPRRRRAILDLLIVVPFLALIATPLLGQLAGTGAATSRAESRRASSRPAVAWNARALVKLPADWTAYFDGHFAFRLDVIRWYNHLAWQWLGISPSPTVLKGRDGWLFYADDGALQDYLSERPFAPADLEQWRQTLQHSNDWLAARHIRYLFVVAPDKHVIYPEYMPPGIHPLQHPSRLDQLVTYLEQHTTVDIVDLRAPLLAAKAHDRVYHRTDSHWNDAGAFVAYSQIADRLLRWFPAVIPWTRDEFREEVHVTPGLDLADMLGLSDVISERRRDFVPLKRRRARIVEPAHPDPDFEEGRLVTVVDNPDLPRAVVFRDSFMSALIPFLSEHFQRAVYLWQNDFDPDVVRQEQPTVVIQELVGRRLTTYLPYDAVAAEGDVVGSKP